MRTLLGLALAVVVSAWSLTLNAKVGSSEEKFRAHAHGVPNSYIVKLKPEVAGSLGSNSKATELAHQLVHRYGGKITKVYSYVLNGFAARANLDTALALSNDKRVAFVEQDSYGTPTPSQPNPPNWGLDRIDQRMLPLDNVYQYPATAPSVGRWFTAVR